MQTILYEIDTADNPAKLDAGLAFKFRVFELPFVQWAATLDVGAIGSQAEIRKAQRAAKMAKQIKALDSEGNELAIKPGELQKLPRRLYVRVTGGVDTIRNATQGKVVAPGDGIDRPVIFRLGTPIKVIGSGTEEAISDLEFVARTGAEIEDVLCETSGVNQTKALIEFCATPLTKDLGLLRLPSWALSQITMADGLAIMEKVLPGFLELDGE